MTPGYGRSPFMDYELPLLQAYNNERKKALMTQDNQHAGLPVKGYEPQSDANVKLVNKMKEAEENVLRMLDHLERLATTDKRWLAIGRTAIEQGFMAANRSVFKPSRLTLLGDPPVAPGPEHYRK